MKQLSRILLGVLFFGAGIMHFTHDADLVAITPLPFAYEIVWITGVMEFAFAIAIQVPKLRYLAGLLLALFCLAVLPANINMAVNDIPMFGEHAPQWILWLRIPMQFVLIAWILWATEAMALFSTERKTASKT